MNIDFWLEFCDVVALEDSTAKEFFRCWCENSPAEEVIGVVMEVFGGVRTVCGRDGMFIPANLGHPVRFTDVLLTTGTSSFIDAA